MRIVIEADESIVGADKPDPTGFVLWNFRGTVECADCVRTVADAAYYAAVKLLKANNCAMTGKEASRND